MTRRILITIFVALVSACKPSSEFLSGGAVAGGTTNNSSTSSNPETGSSIDRPLEISESAKKPSDQEPDIIGYLTDPSKAEIQKPLVPGQVELILRLGAIVAVKVGAKTAKLSAAIMDLDQMNSLIAARAVVEIPNIASTRDVELAADTNWTIQVTGSSSYLLLFLSPASRQGAVNRGRSDQAWYLDLRNPPLVAKRLPATQLEKPLTFVDSDLLASMALQPAQSTVIKGFRKTSDPLQEFDASTGIFTSSTAGTYTVRATADFEGPSWENGSYCKLIAQVNLIPKAVDAQLRNAADGLNGCYTEIFTTLSLNAGDKVSLHALIGGPITNPASRLRGADGAAEGAGGWTSFQIVRIQNR